VVQRRAKKDPPDKGGWNLFCTFNSGVDQSNPATHAWLSTSGASAAPGWPDNPKLEALRVSWMAAQDPKAVAVAIQVEALQDVPYVPIGQYLYATGYRSTLTGVLKGFPVFWNVRRV
jgi:peptide/nickel transport system substrate-binding protein